ncbi:MAG: hypothetical protein ABIG28_02745 [archaeon]
MKKKQKGKQRVNITIDKELLDKAKTKLDHFGGKLSTLFNAYLTDFVDSMQARPTSQTKKIEDLEKRLKKLEDKS